MGQKIQPLDEKVINQIAAGEVIENPASVVKELVENSLDAGATEIAVEIAAGGRHLIRVTDNGSGMSPEDAKLSLARHATSKIRTLDDFETLDTMGFRGEAIASIASISSLTLKTGERGASSGTLIIVEGGKIIQEAKVPLPTGTTFEIRNLFYNVPVRRKFQKSPAQDGIEVYKSLTQIALANPEVQFSLIRDGEVSFRSQKGEERIAAILGKEFAAELIKIEGEEGGIKVAGWIGRPTYTRPNKLGQYLFVNRRPVYSPLVAKAVVEGYGTTLPPQRFPVFVFYLEIPGYEVDVNVHPQKKEIRLRDEGGVQVAIARLVSSALRERPKTAPLPPPKNPFFFEETIPPVAVEEAVEPYIAVQSELPWTPKVSTPRVIATLKGLILAEEGELLVFHQRRAHTRVLFEEFQRKMAGEKGGVESLLIPISFEIPLPEIEEFILQIPSFEALGFSIREIGKGVFQIDEVPQSFSNKDLAFIMREMRAEKTLDELARKMALKGAVGEDEKLGFSEAGALLQALYKTKEPGYCPQGGPTSQLVTEEKLWTTRNAYTH